MKKRYYYGGTLLIYALQVILSLIVDDVGIIFELCGAFSASTISFLVPGYFYLACENRYGTEADKNKMHRIASYIFIILGVIVFFLLFIGSIINMTDGQ